MSYPRNLNWVAGKVRRRAASIIVVAVLLILGAPVSAWTAPLGEQPAFEVTPAPGWTMTRSGRIVTLHRGNDRIELRVDTPADEPGPTSQADQWRQSGHFRAGVLDTTDSWMDFVGPHGRRRRTFHSKVGLHQVSALLEADRGDFAARCTSFSAVLQSLTFHSPTLAAPGSTLARPSQINLAVPLPRNGRVGQLVSVGPAQVKLLAKALEAYLALAMVNDRQKAAPSAAQTPSPAASPPAKPNPLPLPGAIRQLPERLEATSLAAMHQLAASLRHVRGVTVVRGAASETVSCEALVRDYDGWVQEYGGQCRYRQLGDAKTANLIYELGDQERTLIVIRLDTSDRLTFEVIVIEGELEGTLSDIVDQILAGVGGLPQPGLPALTRSKAEPQ